jgi:hypothetical protein
LNGLSYVHFAINGVSNFVYMHTFIYGEP